MVYFPLQRDMLANAHNHIRRRRHVNNRRIERIGMRDPDVEREIVHRPAKGDGESADQV